MQRSSSVITAFFYLRPATIFRHPASRFASRLVLSCALATAELPPALAQTDSLRTLPRQLSRYSQQALPEKLFLHVDRPFYLSGETLWLKVYAVDGRQHKPLAVSKVAYVEVLDNDQRAVLQGKIALQNATGHGSFILPKTLASGSYTIRAYTNWMKNASPDFYFHSAITVVNTFGSVRVKPAKTAVEVEASFFPEGGSLVQGLPSTVGYKIADLAGKGLEASGIIVDQRGNNVAQFKTQKFGLGHFAFTPTEAGATYTALITLPNQQTITRKLPSVAEQGYVLHVASAGPDELTISVRNNLPAEADAEVLLLGHARQMVAVTQVKRLSKNEAVFSVSKRDLAEGISHFTLFNNQKKPLCERLYFKKPTQGLAVATQTDKAAYASRERVGLQLTTSAPATVSLAVYRLDSLASVPTGSINSYFWLASDLKGRIENPDYYFADASPAAETAADNLMLTQGWSRFRWDDVVAGRAPAVTYFAEVNGHRITGQLLSRTSGPAAGIPVYLASPSRQPRLYTALSQPNGALQFETRDFFGPKEIVAQTDTRVDSTYRIELFSPFSTQYAATPAAPFALSEFFRPELAQRHVQTQVQTAYFKKLYSSFRPPANDSIPFYGAPDERYKLDDYTRFKVMEEVMREYVPGVQVRIRKGQFHFQVLDNVNKTIFSEDPLVLLDGVPVFSTNKIMAFDPLKVQKLEVVAKRYFQGPQIYNGVVSYTTYKGDLGGFKLDSHALLQEYDGLQLQREFYSPQYETPQAQQSRVADFRNLLYWNPEVVTAAAAPTSLSFYTADVPGKYVVVVQGLAADGQAGSARFTFEVKAAL